MKQTNGIQLWNSGGRLSVQDQLLRLRQRESSIDDYTLEFRTLAATSSAYRLGLNPHIRTQMVIYDDNVGLESFMQRVSRISQCLTACYEDEAARQLASPASGPPVPEPMQMDSARLSRTERARTLRLDCVCTVHPRIISSETAP